MTPQQKEMLEVVIRSQGKAEFILNPDNTTIVRSSANGHSINGNALELAATQEGVPFETLKKVVTVLRKGEGAQRVLLRSVLRDYDVGAGKEMPLSLQNGLGERVVKRRSPGKQHVTTNSAKGKSGKLKFDVTKTRGGGLKWGEETIAALVEATRTSSDSQSPARRVYEAQDLIGLPKRYRKTDKNVDQFLRRNKDFKKAVERIIQGK